MSDFSILDDILGQLSSLEEQLDIQQSQINNKSSSHIKAHQSGANYSNYTTSNPSSSLFFSTDRDLLGSSSAAGTSKSAVTPQNSLQPQDDVLQNKPNDANALNFDQSIEKHAASNAELKIKESRQVKEDINKSGLTNGTTFTLVGSPVNRVSFDSSSSPHSTHSLNSDSYDGSRPCVHPRNVTSPTLVGLSVSLNSFGNILNHDSHSSASSSGISSSPGKVSNQVCFQVYSPDGTSKTIGSDDHTTAGQLCQLLARKMRIPLTLNMAVLEQVHDLYMERIIEDHQIVTEVLDCWIKNSMNRLMFVEDLSEKFSMFSNDQAVFENDVYTPKLEGPLYLKAEGKKTWKKLYCVLRSSGLYYSLKGKGKSTSELVCLQSLRDVEIFSAVKWKKKYKSPTDYGFALKGAMIQKNAPKYIKYLCAEDSTSLSQWITALRLTKYGTILLDSYRKIKVGLSGSKLTRSATTVGNAQSAEHQDSFNKSREITEGKLSHGGSLLNSSDDYYTKTTTLSRFTKSQSMKLAPNDERKVTFDPDFRYTNDYGERTDKDVGGNRTVNNANLGSVQFPNYDSKSHQKYEASIEVPGGYDVKGRTVNRKPSHSSSTDTLLSNVRDDLSLNSDYRQSNSTDGLADTYVKQNIESDMSRNNVSAIKLVDQPRSFTNSKPVNCVPSVDFQDTMDYNSRLVSSPSTESTEIS